MRCCCVLTAGCSNLWCQGLFYRFDGYYVYTLLISGLVLLSTAKAAAQAYAMYLTANANMIKRRTREELKVERRYADVGLKAALAVQAYTTLGQRTTITAEDICMAFAKTPCTFEQAFAIANLVLEASDTSTLEKKKKQKSGTVAKVAAIGDASREPPSIDFNEFLLASNEGQTMSFEQLVADAPKLAEGKIDETLDPKKCEEAFNAARKAFEARAGDKATDPGMLSPAAARAPLPPLK